MTRYLTNMKNRMKGVAAAAIVSSGRSDIHIDDEPMPYEGAYSMAMRDKMSGHYFSVYVDHDCDCSDFWREYQRLRETTYWKTFLELSKSDGLI